MDFESFDGVSRIVMDFDGTGRYKPVTTEHTFPRDSPRSRVEFLSAMPRPILYKRMLLERAINDKNDKTDLTTQAFHTTRKHSGRRRAQRARSEAPSASSNTPDGGFPPAETREPPRPPNRTTKPAV